MAIAPNSQMPQLSHTKTPVNAPEPEPSNFTARMGALVESRDGRVAFITAAAYLTLFNVTPRLPWSGIGIIVVMTLLSLLLVLLFTVTTARAMKSRRASDVNLLLSALLAIPFVAIQLFLVRFPEWDWRTILQSPIIMTYGSLARVPGMIGLWLMWFAASLGVLIARLVKEMKILLPMAVVLALVDLYVVFGGGLVTQAQSGKVPMAQAAIRALTVALPTASPTTGAAPMQLQIGFADFLFIATFFTCFARFGVRSRYTFYVLCVLLTGYMLFVAQTGISMPALVPVAVVVIGMNVRHFRYSRDEWFAMLYAGLIVGAVLGFMVWRSRH